MKTKYIDLIEQTFDFPQEGFRIVDGELYFCEIPLMELIEKYGTPLKFFYLPSIGKNIERAKDWFTSAMQKANYKGKYHYCYCTKSSHFSFVLEEALKHNIHLETSSAFDIDIIHHLLRNGQLKREQFLICNGFKTNEYLKKIAELFNNGFTNVIPIIDNFKEINALDEALEEPFDIGIRIASEEEPKFQFYTSRLGIGYKDIVTFYRAKLEGSSKIKLKMLHFFINTGIRDTAYYWNELTKCLKVYVELKKYCPDLEYLNIGGGFPIKSSLGFNYDYQYMVDEIIGHVKATCAEFNVEEPSIFTEFGSFTVGESAGSLYSVVHQKAQNDREVWNMIDSSFMTTLPDSWAVNQKFILLPINRWNDSYERVLLGGLTCDSEDYYNSEQHLNAIYLPKFNANKPLYIGFFNTGAYQDSIGGYGGIHHCLIPTPKLIIVNKEEGELKYTQFSEEQPVGDVLKTLGYLDDKVADKGSTMNEEVGYVSDN